MARPQTTAARIKSLTDATDELLRRMMIWLQNKDGQPHVPAQVVTAMDAAVYLCRNGEIPESCEELCVALPQLAEEWFQYDQRKFGSFDADTDAPGPKFFRAASKIATARLDAEVPLQERFESVKTLLEQGLNHHQIATVFGRRGEGPFFQGNGCPDDFLILQERDTPGSVLEGFPDWVPPWQAAIAATKRQELEARLAIFKEAAEPKQYNDPGTIESMLLDGCYVQQIEKGKHVSRQEILQEAHRLGIKAVDAPGYSPALEDSAENEDEAAANDKDELKRQVIEMYTANSDTMGAAEITTALRATFPGLKTVAVAAILRHHRKRLQDVPAETVEV